MRSSSRARWLFLLALAWASSASFAFGFEATGISLLICMLCFAARAFCRDARRRAIATLIALTLPLQGIAGVSMQAHGPAHFHGGAAPHSHRHVERHHHVHGSDAVSVEQGQPLSALALFGENRGLDAAPAGTTLPPLAVASAAVRCDPEPSVLLHSPVPHERPPRI